MNMELRAWQGPRTGTGNSPEQNITKAQVRCRCFGVFQLDLQRQKLFKDGTPLKLQGKVYQALLVLIEAPGEIITRETLRMRLWPRDTRLHYDANVNTTVNKLRQVLGDTNEESRYIATIPRQGYRFVANVEDYVDEPARVSESRDVRVREPGISRWNLLRTSQILSSTPAGIWFTASVIAWVLAAVLFGAAITLYSHRSIPRGLAAHPAAQDTQSTSKP